MQACRQVIGRGYPDSKTPVGKSVLLPRYLGLTWIVVRCPTRHAHAFATTASPTALDNDPLARFQTSPAVIVAPIYSQVSDEYQAQQY